MHYSISTDYMQVKKYWTLAVPTVSSHYVLPSERDVVRCEDGLSVCLSVCLMAAQILGTWI